MLCAVFRFFFSFSAPSTEIRETNEEDIVRALFHMEWNSCRVHEQHKKRHVTLTTEQPELKLIILIQQGCQRMCARIQIHFTSYEALCRKQINSFKLDWGQKKCVIKNSIEANGKERKNNKHKIDDRNKLYIFWRWWNLDEWCAYAKDVYKLIKSR